MSASTPLEITGMESLYNPASIAVVGASPTPGKPGNRPLPLLKSQGYNGRIAAVNPNYSEVEGIPCYPTLLDVPFDVEMAVISVPAALVMNVLRHGAEKGIRSAVIFTAGFAEIDQRGRRLQDEMTAFARAHGIRLMGPNCIGLMNLTNGVMATFATSAGGEIARPAVLAFISQSGAFGNMAHRQAREAGVGFSSFASVGNEAETEFADYVHYLLRDPEARVIGGYMESAKDGRKLRQVAEQALLMGKPICILKVGRTSAGARAASSHTGSLAGNDAIYSAFFRQMGIVRLDDLGDLTNFVLLHQTGRNFEKTRVCILGGSGGHGVRLSDQCESHGLTVPELSRETRQRLEEIMPDIGSARNPIDFTTQGSRDQDLTCKCLEEIANCDDVDIIFMRGRFGGSSGRNAPAGRWNGRFANQIIEVQRTTDKPIVMTESKPYRGRRNRVEQSVFDAGIASLPDGMVAAKAVAQLSWYQRKVRRALADAERERPRPPVDSQLAKDLLAGGEQLLEAESKQVLREFGIPVTPEELVTSREEAIAAAERIGYPVVLKIQSRQILHKTEANGICLNLTRPDEVAKAYDGLRAHAGAYDAGALIEGVLVQKMVKGGVETIVGVTTDPVFGPVVMFGLGGIFVEVLKDVSFRVAPLRLRDAEEMCEEIRGSGILSGARGRDPLDRGALIDVLLKLSQLATEHADRIEELDINPLLLFSNGAVALDALITKKKA